MHWKKDYYFQVRFSLLSSNFHGVFFSQLLKFHTKKKIQFIHNWTRTTHFYVMNCLFSRTSILSVEMIKNLTFRYFNISISSIGIKSFAKIYFEGLRSINPSIHPHPYWTGKKYWDRDDNDCRPLDSWFLIIKQYSDKTLYASKSLICSSCFDKIMMMRQRKRQHA